MLVRRTRPTIPLSPLPSQKRSRSQCRRHEQTRPGPQSLHRTPGAPSWSRVPFAREGWGSSHEQGGVRLPDRTTPDRFSTPYPLSPTPYPVVRSVNPVNPHIPNHKPICLPKKQTTSGRYRLPASSPTFSTARNASCGMSTLPILFMRFLPSFCFSSSLRFREMSPP
jgi:hypothetical protein